MIDTAIKKLELHGFKIIQSYDDSVIQFYGSEFDIIKAHEVLSAYNIKIDCVRRVYQKEDLYLDNDDIQAKIIGLKWMDPVNEIVIYRN